MGTQVLPSLSIVPSGGLTANPQELLSTPRFQALLNETVREFDLVLIDTPPANMFADAQRVAKVAGCCAIVARREKTYFQDVSQLVRQLRADGVTIVGTILNQF
jgi:receptor protein-tyrosine kinase